MLAAVATAFLAASSLSAANFGPFPPPPVEDVVNLNFGPFPPPPVEDVVNLNFGPFPPPPVEDIGN